MELRTKSVRPQTCRMFETPIIERFSRVHPLAPFVFWSPFVLYFAWSGWAGGLGVGALVLALLTGMLIWSLLEYLLHRFVFHRIAPTAAGRRLYFVLHGVHHDFPTDATRLVMPLGVSIPIGFFVYLILRAAVAPVAPVAVDPVFAGFGIGYLAYDGIHFATHKFRMTAPVARFLKRYHMVHHHTGENARWGVSSPLWDVVFGTMGKKTQPAAATVSVVKAAD